MKPVPPARPYEEGLYKRLRDPEHAAHYLNAVVDDGDPDGILLALYDIMKAHNFSHVAEQIKVHRPSLYKMMSRSGNPGFRNILKVLNVVGLEIRFARARKLPKAA